MNISINQVRHLYVANTLGSGDNLEATVDAGTILPKGNDDQTYIYFQYMSPGGLVRSDLIDVDKIVFAKATGSDSLAYNLKRVLLELDADVSSSLIAGQEYITRIIFRQYIGLGEEDQNQKYGYVKATASMSTSDFYAKMAISIAKNVAEDTTPLLTVYVYDGSTATEVTKTTKEDELTGTYTGIILEEVEQPWILGMMQQEIISFTVQPTEIVMDGDHFIWGTVTKQDPENSIPDGHNIADLEYFCMGARGDHYRMIGYPNVIFTKYLVDPSEEYDTLDIHYYFTDSNESVQKSEKDITLVCVNDGSHTDMNALINAINALLPSDKQIDTLS